LKTSEELSGSVFRISCCSIDDDAELPTVLSSG